MPKTLEKSGSNAVFQGFSSLLCLFHLFCYFFCEVLFFLLNTFAYFIAYHFHNFHGFAQLLCFFLNILSNCLIAVLYELLIYQAYLFEDGLDLARNDAVEQLRLLALVEQLLLCDLCLRCQPILINLCLVDKLRACLLYTSRCV